MDYLVLISTLKKVYDCKIYVKASQELFLSQPAVSRKIKDLETYYQDKLIYKKENHLYLTSLGKLIYEEASQIEKIRKNTNFALHQNNLLTNDNSAIIKHIGILEQIFLNYTLRNQTNSDFNNKKIYKIQNFNRS